MKFEPSLFENGLNLVLNNKQAVNQVMKCNPLTEKYGFTLTESQALTLVETRSLALKATGRIEFGEGIIDKIILAFCDSSHLTIYNYEETLHQLIDAFYYFKNETLDLFGDDQLIQFMKMSFDGICQGSVDLILQEELEKLSRNLRYGYENQDIEEDIQSEESENELS